MPKYFDIHSHPHFPQYGGDQEAMIQRLKDTGTHTIAIGTDLKTSKEAVELAEKYEEIYACIGVHPVDDPNVTFDPQAFSELVKHPKVVAIGECGLDFFHGKKEEDFERQKALFIQQVEFAITYDKPIMIHARDAYVELLEILELMKATKGDRLRGNVHFFAGDWETAQRFFATGFTVSFTGVITFTSDYDETIKKAPLDKIMAETDAPYVAPVPYRGKRNEPSYVSEVVRRISEIRGEPLEEVRGALVNNALFMIGLSPLN